MSPGGPGSGRAGRRPSCGQQHDTLTFCPPVSGQTRPGLSWTGPPSAHSTASLSAARPWKAWFPAANVTVFPPGRPQRPPVSLRLAPLNPEHTGGARALRLPPPPRKGAPHIRGHSWACRGGLGLQRIEQPVLESEAASDPGLGSAGVPTSPALLLRPETQGLRVSWRDEL